MPSASEKRGRLADALGVAAGLVVTELRRDREALERVEVCPLQLGGALAHPPLQQLVLRHDLAVQPSRLQQIRDAEQQLVRLERLGDEVLRPGESAFGAPHGWYRPVMTRTGRYVCGPDDAPQILQDASPSRFGMCRSSRMRSGCC